MTTINTDTSTAIQEAREQIKQHGFYGKVAYSWGGILHVLNLSTGETRIYPLVQGMWYPDWRPDGRFITAGWGKILIIDTERDVFDTLNDGGRFPNWSPNGEWLVYNHMQAGLVLHNPKTGLVHQLLPPAPFGAFQAEWFPDGESIVFVGLRSTGQAGREEKHLMRLNVNCLQAGNCGAEIVPITTTGTDNHAPTVSPDGEWIAYERFDPTLGTWGIFVIPAEGGDAVRLTAPDVNAHHPTWAMDGSHLIFTLDQTGGGPVSNLYIMRVDGTALIQLTQQGGADPDWTGK